MVHLLGPIYWSARRGHLGTFSKSVTVDVLEDTYMYAMACCTSMHTHALTPHALLPNAHLNVNTLCLFFSAI